MTAPLAPEVNVKFKASGVEGVQRGLKLVGASGESTGRQVGGAMRQIAGGAEMVARQGKVTGEALKQVIASGAEMAFMFGAGGPIVGALAIVGLAIYEHITGRMKEARDEINKARSELESLARGDLVSAGHRQQTLFSGERGAIRKEGESAAAFLARSQGIEGVRGRLSALADQFPADKRAGILADAQAYALGGVPWSQRPGKIQTEMIDLYKELSKLTPQFEALTRITENLSTQEGERAKNAKKVSDEEYLKNLPLSPEQIARHMAFDKIVDPALKRGLPGVQSSTLGGTFMTTRLGGDEGYRAFGLKAADLGKGFEAQFVNPLGETISKTIGDVIGSSIQSGFDAAFAKGGNIAAGAKALLGTATATMGGVFKDIGIQSLLGMQFMQSIKLAIASWNPALGVAASIGLIALGSAMQSAGGRLSSGGGGGGFSGGGGSSSSAPMIVDRGFINPTSAASAAGSVSMRNVVVLAPTIIGADSITAQRAVKELIRNADRRGDVGTV